MCAFAVTAASAAGASSASTAATPRVVGETCSSPSLHQRRLAIQPAPAPCARSAAGATPSAPQTGCQLYTVGCEQWRSTPFHGAANRTDDEPGDFTSSHVMATSPDGGIVYLGASTDDGGSATQTHYDLTTLAYNATTGATLWSQSYPGAQSALGGLVNSVVAGGGGVYATGELLDPPTETSVGAVTVAYDASGHQRWVASAPSAERDDATDSALSPDGSVLYVSEGGASPANQPEAWVVAYDTADGHELWSAVTTGVGVSRIAISADGSPVYATQTHAGGESVDAIDVVGYDTTTHAQTVRFTEPTNGFWGAPIVVSHDGSRIFVEEITYNAGENGGLTFAVTSSGTFLWSALVGGGTCPSATAECSDFDPWYYQPIAVSPDGSRVFVSGYNGGVYYLPQSQHLPTDSSEPGFETIAFDAASGTRQWTDQTSTAFGLCLGCGPVVSVSPDGGQVFVSGTNPAPEVLLVATFAYNAVTGAQSWSSVLDASPDTSSAIAVSPNGDRVYVGGTIEPTDGQAPDGFGVVAVAYSTAGGTALPVSLPESPVAALLAAAGAAGCAGTEVVRRRRRRPGC